MRILTYAVGKNWVVADDSGWLPGSYESQKAAHDAAMLSQEDLIALTSDRGEGDAYRTITEAEVEVMKNGCKAHSRRLRSTSDPYDIVVYRCHERAGHDGPHHDAERDMRWPDSLRGG